MGILRDAFGCSAVIPPIGGFFRLGFYQFRRTFAINCDGVLHCACADTSSNAGSGGGSTRSAKIGGTASTGFANCFNPDNCLFFANAAYRRSTSTANSASNRHCRSAKSQAQHPSNQRLKTALNDGLEEIDSAKLSYGNNGFLTEFPQWFPHHAMPTPCL